MSNIFPKPIEELSRLLCTLPGIGKRTSERLALALFDWEGNQLNEFSRLLASLKERIKNCQICGNLTEYDVCEICQDPKRDSNIICIIENARQIPVIDKCGRYNGLFHVLGGRLNPLSGVHAENLRISTLIDRIKKHHVNEIIISTSPDVEGEATAVYLANELNQKFDIKVTRIALGVPMGSDLTFADSATMAMAIASRRVI